MSELTDLEICKRIAEIDGEDFTVINDTLLISCENGCISYGGAAWSEFNPLTDDALCFRLMVKYKITMEWLWEECDGTPHYQAYPSEGVLSDNEYKYSKSPNRAICLAIIEANKD